MVLSRPISAFLLGTGLSFLGCTPTPEPLPTQEAIKNLDRNKHRRSISCSMTFLRCAGGGTARSDSDLASPSDLNPGQLTRLDELRALADERRGRIMAAEEEASARWKQDESSVYQRIWDHLSAGKAVDDPDMAELTELKESVGGERERELLKLRLQGRAVFEAPRDLLASSRPPRSAPC